MKKLLLCVFILLQTIKLSAHKNINGRVLDEAGIIENEEIINKILIDQEKKYKTGVQILVATTPSLNGKESYQYASDLGTEIGVGQSGSNTRIVILIAPNDRKWFIATGYGMEYIITDAECKQIGEESIIKSEFKQGIYDPSIIRIIDNLHKKIGTMSKYDRENWKKQEQAAAVKQQEKNREDFKAIMWNIFLIIFGICIVCTIIFLIQKMIKRKEEIKRVRTILSTIIDSIDKKIEFWSKYYSIDKYSDIKFELQTTLKNTITYDVVSSVEEYISRINQTITNLNEKYEVYHSSMNMSFSKNEVESLKNFKEAQSLLEFDSTISINDSTSTIKDFILNKKKKINNFNKLKEILNTAKIFKTLNSKYIEIPSIKNTIDFIDFKLNNNSIDGIEYQIEQAKKDIETWEKVSIYRFLPLSILDKLTLYHNKYKLYDQDYNLILDMRKNEIFLIENFNSTNKKMINFKELTNSFIEIETFQSKLSAAAYSLLNAYIFFENEQNRFPILLNNLINRYKDYKLISYHNYDVEFNNLLLLNFSLENNKKIDNFINKIQEEIEVIKAEERRKKREQEEEEKRRKKKREEEEAAERRRRNSSYGSSSSSYNNSSSSYNNSSSSYNNSSSSSSFGGGSFGGGGGGGDW